MPLITSKMSTNIRLQRICQHCGDEFTAKTTVTKYCGDTCAKRAYKARKKAEKISSSNKETLQVKKQPIEDVRAKEFLTAKDAALLLGFSLRTVYRLINNGTLEAVNLGERLTRIHKSSLDQLLTKPIPKKKIKEIKIEDCYNIGEIQRKFNISEKALYQVLKREQIQKMKKGKFSYVPKQVIENLLT
jgi:excisionase family DNA binding protein